MKNRFPSTKLSPWPLVVLTGLLLTGYAYYLYVNTNIPDRFVLAVYLTGTALFFIIMKWWKPSAWQPVIRILVSLACGGGVLMAVVLWTNKTFASIEIMEADFQVISRGAESGGSGIKTPYLYVDFNGNNKQLSFYPEAGVMVGKAQKVKIKYQRGLLGFEVIGSRALYP